MPATLDTSLVDDLVPTIDSLRAELLPAFGVRAHTVYLVRRQWSGAKRLIGEMTIISEIEMSPPPLMTDGAPRTTETRYELKSHGRDEEGEVQASEISLTYTEAELTGGVIAPNEEFFWKVVDAHGQEQRVRYYVPAAPPRVDREKSIGWMVILKRADVKV